MEKIITHNYSIVATHHLNPFKTMETILYTNYFKVANKTFAFKKTVLFNITNIPTKLDLKDNNGSKGYWINRE